MAGSWTQLRVEMLGHVAHVQLARPDRLNALTNVMFGELVAAGNELARQADCGAVVISGEGRGFCSGLPARQLSILERSKARGARSHNRSVATPKI